MFSELFRCRELKLQLTRPSPLTWFPQGNAETSMTLLFTLVWHRLTQGHMILHSQARLYEECPWSYNTFVNWKRGSKTVMCHALYTYNVHACNDIISRWWHRWWCWMRCEAQYLTSAKADLSSNAEHCQRSQKETKGDVFTFLSLVKKTPLHHRAYLRTGVDLEKFS